eukprot:GHVO01044124.1.p1 GENE.GHVO01044124.1~~GHVO01044124.1.p1  ORF type:complete len:228 (+),score=30.70 GHVO01044124.1:152-835(+)
MSDFYRSRFFDASSLNQQRRKGMSIAADADGVQYVLAKANSAAVDESQQRQGTQWNFPNQFGVFVISKIRRKDNVETPLDSYYIISGTIYKAPTLSVVLRNRILNAVKNIYKCYTDLSDLHQWSLSRGHSWSQISALEATQARWMPKQIKDYNELNERVSKRRLDTTDENVQTFPTKRPCPHVNEVCTDKYKDLVQEGTAFMTKIKRIREMWEQKDTETSTSTPPMN